MAGALVGFIAGRWSVSHPERAFATFDGGVVQDREVLDLLHAEVQAAIVIRVKRKMLELEAQKAQLTPEQWLDKASASGEPTEDDVRTFMSNQGMDLKKVTPEILENSRKIVRSQRAIVMGNQVLDDLYSKAGVKLHF